MTGGGFCQWAPKKRVVIGILPPSALRGDLALDDPDLLGFRQLGAAAFLEMEQRPVVLGACGAFAGRTH